MIEHKNNRKKCQLFVVPGNGQVILGMLDTDELQTININIDSIDADDMGDNQQYVNTSTAQESNTKQKTDGTAECCANTGSFSKSTNNSTKSMVDTNSNKSRKLLSSRSKLSYRQKQKC